ncbi:uncharacterized protein LOC130997361 [Salvia miltiorrhiza]|uniref:uncharacterized protein LOC130997361 n=1 Tax=Salvia miltiorrhiza TaxID=226208 RepID=UPI0025AC3977|nr:uncharacterized protein LOC130997361 [Salvia miltiorrhiza]
MNVFIAPKQPAVGSAIAKSAEVGGRANLEVGCEADVVLGDAMQTGRLAMTNIAKRGKENFVFENPKNVDLRVCVGAKTQQRTVLRPLVPNVVPMQPSPLTNRCRGKDALKKSSFNLSPYIERSINASKRLNKKEKLLGMFAIYNAAEEDDEVLFACGDTILRRMNFRTLHMGNIVDIDVINAWCLLLNYNELLRSTNSVTPQFL